MRSKQRDTIPKDNSLIRMETSTYNGFHSTSAALFAYSGVVVGVRVPLFATQDAGGTTCLAPLVQHTLSSKVVNNAANSIRRKEIRVV